MGLLKGLDLATIAGGAVAERFAHEAERIAGNIMDPNTEATAKREIVIKIGLKPSKDRQSVAVISSVVSKVAPTRVIDGIAYVGVDKDGVPRVVEADMNQPGLFDETDEPSEDEEPSNVTRLAAKKGSA